MGAGWVGELDLSSGSEPWMPAVEEEASDVVASWGTLVESASGALSVFGFGS